MAQGRVLAGFIVGVGDVEGVVEEEGFLGFGALVEVALHIIGEELWDPDLATIQRGHAGTDEIAVRIVLRVLGGAGNDGVGEVHDLAVSNEGLGVEVVRVAGADVAKRFIEALSLRIIERQRLAQAVFADAGGVVACGLEELGQGEVIVRDVAFAIAAHAAVAGVQACHEDAARWRAHGTAGVMARELHALGGHLVKVRRLQSLLPVAAGVAVAHVIGEDIDDVGLVRCVGERAEEKQSEDEKRLHGV